jgi:hypothetical protein
MCRPPVEPLTHLKLPIVARFRAPHKTAMENMHERWLLHRPRERHAFQVPDADQRLPRTRLKYSRGLLLSRSSTPLGVKLVAPGGERYDWMPAGNCKLAGVGLPTLQARSSRVERTSRWRSESLRVVVDRLIGVSAGSTTRLVILSPSESVPSSRGSKLRGVPARPSGCR